MPFFSKDQSKIEIRETRIIHRISIKRFFASVLDAFNIDRGGVYSLKRLFKDPGKLTLDYLYTGRYHYTHPFRLLLISTTFILLLINYTHFFSEMLQGFERGSGTFEANELQDALTDFLNLLLWIYIPIIACFTWLLNRKREFNFAENMVLQTYLLSLCNLLFPIMLLDRIWPQWVVAAFIACVYYVMAYRNFFGKSWWRATFEMLGILILSSVLYFLVFAFILGIIIGIRH